MEGKNPREIKGWVVKWQRVLVTPFRDATAMEAEPTPCKWYPRYLREKDKMTCERYIHI